MDANTPFKYHETLVDDKEAKSLNDFKTALATITEKSIKNLINPDLLLNDDLLIHFLRARKSNIKKAVKMITDYLKWKEKINLDNIYSNYIFKQKHQVEYIFPHGFHKTTKNGNPINFQIIGMLNPEELFKIATHEELITHAIQMYETIERDLYRICSNTFGKYIHGTFAIMDFKGITKALLNKKIFSYLKDNTKICQDYFPESMEGCYILNAGMIFRALYSTCKVFIDAKTKKKIKVFANNYQNDLLQIIDSKNLPTFWGGECDCPDGCLFSNEGPWKICEKKEELTEDVIQKRKEVTDIIKFGKLQTDPEDHVKDQSQGGVSGDVYK